MGEYNQQFAISSFAVEPSPIKNRKINPSGLNENLSHDDTFYPFYQGVSQV
jgi:hypothetical protein